MKIQPVFFVGRDRNLDRARCFQRYLVLVSSALILSSSASADIRARNESLSRHVEISASAHPGLPTVGTATGLTFGAVTIYLGMPRASALSELGKHYGLQRITHSTEVLDDWVIVEKTHTDKFVGSVRFRSGQMTLASKHWTRETQEYSGVDTAEIIYKVMSKFEKEGNVNCTVRTFSSLPQSGPGGLEFRQTQFVCAHRQVDISLTWQSSDSWVEVSESITDEPPGE